MMSSNADGRFVHKDGTPYPSPRIAIDRLRGSSSDPTSDLSPKPKLFLRTKQEHAINRAVVVINFTQVER